MNVKILNLCCVKEKTLNLGHVTVLVGPNASGKTSVLRAVAGLQTSNPQFLQHPNGSPVLLMGELGEMVRGGESSLSASMDGASITITAKGGRKITGEGRFPPLLAGMMQWANMTVAQKQQAIRQMMPMSCSPIVTVADIRKKVPGFWPKNSDLDPVDCEKLEANYKAELTDLRARWKAVTGATYGAVAGPTWTPADMTTDQCKMDHTAAAARAEEHYTAMSRKEAVDLSRMEEWEKTAVEVDDDKNTLDEYHVMVSILQAEIWQQGNEPTQPTQPYPPADAQLLPIPQAPIAEPPPADAQLLPIPQAPTLSIGQRLTSVACSMCQKEIVHNCLSDAQWQERIQFVAEQNKQAAARHITQVEEIRKNNEQMELAATGAKIRVAEQNRQAAARHTAQVAIATAENDRRKLVHDAAMATYSGRAAEYTTNIHDYNTEILNWRMVMSELKRKLVTHQESLDAKIAKVAKKEQAEANLAKAKAGAVTPQQVEDARRDMIIIRESMHGANAWKKAQEINTEIQAVIALAVIVGPSGIRQEKMDLAIPAINGRLFRLCALANWPIIALSADLTPTCGGRRMMSFAQLKIVEIAITMVMAAMWCDKTTEEGGTPDGIICIDNIDFVGERWRVGMHRVLATSKLPVLATHEPAVPADCIHSKMKIYNMESA